jgi:hypothetical protein
LPKRTSKILSPQKNANFNFPNKSALISKNLTCFKKILVLLLLLSNIICSYSANPRKLALLIAIGNYPKETGWQQINSLNDLPLISAALIRQGFDARNITMLTDSQATKSHIVNATKSLTSSAKQGDIIVIHYSGHGQQIQDDNNDEVDGYDESLIPYDAFKYYKKGIYTGQNHLRDDELGQLLSVLRKKIGKEGEILVTIDACHSGTATRGSEFCRGTDIMFQEPGYSPASTNTEKVNYLEDIQAVRGAAVGLAPLIIISGSGKHELNYEYYDQSGKSFGSLSYVISKLISNAQPGISYNTLFEKIKLEMKIIAPRQSPQIEGDINKLILGGRTIKQKEYYEVEKWINDHEIIISSGTLTGLTETSKIAIYPFNTFNPSHSNPVTIGTVKALGVLSSKITLSSPIAEAKALNSWVFVVSQSDNISATRANTFRNLKSFDKTLRVDMEMIPITVKQIDGAFIEDKRLTINTNKRNGVLEFSEGDCFKLKLINKGTKNAYYQVIDIQPDNKIILLIPYGNHTSQEFCIKPNESIEIKQIYSLTKPCGTEVYKLIATANPINMNMLRSNAGYSREILAEPLEILFSDLYSGGERSVSIDTEFKAVHISTISINVTSK